MYLAVCAGPALQLRNLHAPASTSLRCVPTVRALLAIALGSVRASAPALSADMPCSAYVRASASLTPTFQHVSLADSPSGQAQRISSADGSRPERSRLRHTLSAPSLLATLYLPSAPHTLPPSARALPDNSSSVSLSVPLMAQKTRGGDYPVYSAFARCGLCLSEFAPEEGLEPSPAISGRSSLELTPACLSLQGYSPDAH